jgi:hypothetical protein
VFVCMVHGTCMALHASGAPNPEDGMFFFSCLFPKAPHAARSSDAELFGLFVFFQIWLAS